MKNEILSKQFLRDSLGWGFVLWLIGYGLSMMLFTVVPTSILGWIIMPIGTAITLWVLFKKIQGTTFPYYVFLGLVWALIAVVFDYLFIVMAFSPTDGYYKLDVYIYYFMMLALPLIVGLIRTKK